MNYQPVRKKNKLLIHAATLASTWCSVKEARSARKILYASILENSKTVKNLQCKRPRFYPWIGKTPWRREWQATPVLLPGEFQGQKSLVCYSPWAHKELDVIEWLTLWIHGKTMIKKKSILCTYWRERINWIGARKLSRETEIFWILILYCLNRCIHLSKLI